MKLQTDLTMKEETLKLKEESLKQRDERISELQDSLNFLRHEYQHFKPTIVATAKATALAKDKSQAENK